MKTLPILVCLLAAAALATPASAQQRRPGTSGKPVVTMYKCKDAKGKTYYSDKMNPDCIEGAEMTRQGTVLEKPAAAKPAQAGKKDDTPAKPANTQERERRDRALLATYTSEAEIDTARERSLAIPLQGIKVTQGKLDKSGKQLTDLKKQADALAAQKKPLPAHLTEDVQLKQKEVERLEAELAQKQGNTDAIKARYDADKLRFRELKGGN